MGIKVINDRLQIELPGPLEVPSFVEHFGEEKLRNAEVSGGKILNLQEDWAVVIGAFGKAHYFRAMKTDPTSAIALCGQKAPLDAMYGAGTYHKCRTCLRKRK